MTKATLKNVALALTILSLVIVVLVAIDSSVDINVSQNDTYLRVNVLDLDGNAVHNAEVTVCGQSYFTDNKGLSPTIQLTQLSNSYDSSIDDWYTVNVSIKKEGYVPAVIFNCVVYDKQTRKLTIKIYPKDNSGLPYVCYVESPPDSFVTDYIK